MNSRVIKIFFLVIPAVITAIITLGILRNMLFQPVAPGTRDVVRIEISQGKGLSQIALDLKDKGVIRSVFGLKLLARLKSSGSTIKAGEYELSPSMSPNEVLKKLVSGDIIKRKILVKEGASISEIANSVEQAGLLSKEEFLTAAKDKAMLDKYGVLAQSFEGYLYPDTYFFSRPTTAQEVLWTMFHEAENHWDPKFSDQCDLMHMSRHQVLTLASIVEKETGRTDEMPIIASVFMNRLQQNWKLESDPTVIYGLQNYNGNITKADLQNPHPYNTYQHFGLPPGPIANPSEKAIRAVLFPRATNFMFFVADGTGGHTFSVTLKEHNEAVAKYLQQQGPGAQAPATLPDPSTAQPPATATEPVPDPTPQKAPEKKKAKR